ncbi:DUF554 domain-containing protein [Peptostreptococcus equinus]|uniref:DUF554 domain-containing protein n=1 Tax=Peptostreptococcus equinus TaxID=3003601 RepID=A0ABY7JQE4_9FIRM|nr:DUF554 domain-containing protein [Peptostreptococcus sp. CBA3647]WAW14714.1 DUF554 domain-containing protein [Peptostreptococcus sp. CBA3647]
MQFVLLNGLAIMIGSIIGVLLKKGIPEEINKALMKAMGLVCIYIGIGLMLKGKNSILIIVAIGVGTLLGEILNIDGRINRLGARIQSRFTKNSNSKLTEGFVTASVLFCAGGMGVVGALNVGLSGNGDILMAKSVLDFIVSIVFSATLGIGVGFSSITLILYQGIFVLLASILSPFMKEAAIGNISGVGGIIIIAIGFNLALESKIRATNIAMAIFIPIILALFGIV